jgi:lipoprotein NlpD
LRDLNQFSKIISLSLICGFILSGCGSTHTRAPIIERASGSRTVAVTQRESDWRPEYYTVKKGDTLYSISLDHGYDYREVAAWNQIDNPHVISVGQQLKMRPPQSASSGATTSPLKTSVLQNGKSLDLSQPGPVVQTDTLKTYPKAVKLSYSKQAVADVQKLSLIQPPAKTEPNQIKTAKAQEKSDVKALEQQDSSVNDDEVTDWIWPANGKVLSGFSEGNKAKGLDIGGKLGQPIVASAPGKVVYSGTGIRGLGKLIVIKHNKTYLSAYAHNSQILVKEGQSVTKGQKIAEMGNTDTDQTKLHFEIRRLGKPVDPIKYLGNEKNS